MTTTTQPAPTDLTAEMQKLTTLKVGLETPADFNPATHGLFHVMDRKAGDFKIIWDRTKPAEVEAAKTLFESLKKKGYAAFSVEGKDGTQGALIREFDPSAERLIMALPVTGG